MLDMLRREWYEIISLEEIKNTHPKKFGNNANVVSIIKTILEMDAFSVMVSHCWEIVTRGTLSCLDHCEIRSKGLAIRSYLHHDTFELLEWFWRRNTVLLDGRSIALLFQRFLDQGDVWFCLRLAINCESETYIDSWASRHLQQCNDLPCHQHWQRMYFHPTITS